MTKLAAWMGTAAVVLGTLLTSPASAQSVLDSNLNTYRPTANALSGEITIIGSDAMTQLASGWGETFCKFYPKVKINLVSASSTRAVLAVRDKKADFALMSREVLPEELDDFEKTMGYKPTLMISSMERIAVLVDTKNPIEGLTLNDLDGIFSATHKRNAKRIGTWGEVGVRGDLANQPIRVVLRDEPTGAPKSFREIVMMDQDFRTDASLQDSYVNVAKTVAKEHGSISFAGTMYMLRGVKAVPIAAEKGQPFIEVDSAQAEHGLYPLIRPQHMVMNHDPKSKPTELQAEFLKYIFSSLGQEDVVKAGFDPISAAPAKIALESVGLNSLN